MRMARVTYAITALVLAVVGVSTIVGCGRERVKDPDEATVIATINAFELTAADFKNEARRAFQSRPLEADGSKAKEALLEELVTKKLLIEEAQKQNFDKERSFMKEIERYWEQALLKLLMKKKADELGVAIVVDEREVSEAYDRLSKDNAAIEPYAKLSPELRAGIFNEKLKAALRRWVDEVRQMANVTLHKERLNDIKIP